MRKYRTIRMHVHSLCCAIRSRIFILVVAATELLALFIAFDDRKLHLMRLEGLYGLGVRKHFYFLLYTPFTLP